MRSGDGVKPGDAARPAEDADALRALVERLLQQIVPGAQLSSLNRLSGGASQESWLIEGEAKGGLVEFVLRRAPGGDGEKRSDAIGLQAEAEVIRAAQAHHVPVPEVMTMLTAQDGLGTGFVMRRVHGETVARKIFRDNRFASVRPLLAGQCGAALAKISRVPIDACPQLPSWPARKRLEDCRAVHISQGLHRPVFEYAFRWLYDHLPAEDEEVKLVHGDFRNGNLIIDENGIAAVLDWEIAHFGSPVEDLGWLCVPSWRFGRIDDVAGGFGSVEQLIEGFETAGGSRVDRHALHFWTVLGTLMWGLVCVRTALEFRAGRFAVEPAVIGRRTSEVELDLMMLTGAREGELL